MNRQAQERLIERYGEAVARSIHDEEVSAMTDSERSTRILQDAASTGPEVRQSPWVKARASQPYAATLRVEPTLGDRIPADRQARVVRRP